MPLSKRFAASTTFEAIGTVWTIDTQEPLSAITRAMIDARVDAFDRTYSRFREDSLVGRIARGTGVFPFPDDAGPLFDLYRQLYEATDGAVTPLVGRALENLGYDRAYSLRQLEAARPVPPWDDAFAWDGTSLSSVRPVVVDVGAAGKGYLVDLVAALLRDAGITEYTVDASGDMAHSGAEVLRVGLEHPLDRSKAIGIVELRDQALCASAVNRRTWGNDLHHVIDAATGLPTRNVIATWAIAPTALLADGLATALFFAGGDRLGGFDFQFVRMFSNGRVETSARFDGELFA